MADFTTADLDALSRLHVAVGIFAEIDLPSGPLRLHNGIGRKEIGGHMWEGVSNPFGGALVEVGDIEEPEFGQAPAIDIGMSGGNRAFLKTIWDDRFDMEGARCDLFIYSEDAETGEVLIPLKKVFPGKLTGFRFRFVGANVRTISSKVVSVFEGLNFPATDAQWSPAGQRARYPGDRGLDQINAKIIEEFKA